MLKCLIIAAGMGTRLAKMGEPKPLTQLNGLPIIVRIINTVKETGIKRFVIVIGYLGHKIKEVLGDGSKYEVEIEYVENPEWQKANGISILKAKNMLNENFTLVMGDHIFDKLDSPRGFCENRG